MTEVNFDGLIGPTHNYSGLAYGNIASQASQLMFSNPREAALQGLEKMWFLASLGIPQGIIPPHERPHLPTLRRLGYHGSDAEIAAKAAKEDPNLFLAVSSASSMWTANAATISPSADTGGNVIITPANLCAKFHRAIETEMTAKILQMIFPDPMYFTHNPPLISNANFGDEGAANHLRFCSHHDSAGIEVFVHGRHAFKPNIYLPNVFPARQSDEAGYAIARTHNLTPKSVLHIQQNPQAIDAGAFHCDVVAVSNCNVLFYHELAFVESDTFIEKIRTIADDVYNLPMVFIKVTENQVPLKDAISSYLFNSQIISLSDGEMALIAPMECQHNPSVQMFIENMHQDASNPISHVHFLEVRQSMLNGGGPACLRIRVAVNEKELGAIDQRFLLTERLYRSLKEWITKHYRTKLHPNDLHDPTFIAEMYHALDELTKVLNVDPFYEFQHR